MSDAPALPSFQAIAGAAPMPGGAYDLATLGYEEQEYLLEGVARSYRGPATRPSDGRWEAELADQAPYVTRFVVRRPIDRSRASGTVVVEWNNVSAGMDVSPDWSLLHRHLSDQGHVWVGLSAQAAGIHGGGIAEGLHLKLLDPLRYAPLAHPGDAFSFDLFSQLALLLRSGADCSPLGELSVERLLGMGESQSAAFLSTYVNGIDGQVAAFDGYFIHGRPGQGAPLDGYTSQVVRDLEAQVEQGLSLPEQIRLDARVPVLVLQSETDLIVLGGAAAQQPDGEKLRQWELAGAAHADTYLLVASNEDDGSLTPTRLAELLRPTRELLVGETERPINAGPQQHYVGQAAFAALSAWIAGGEAPAEAGRLELDGQGSFQLDELGIARGGVRSPWVEVPLWRFSGLGQGGEAFAVLFGTSEALDLELLGRLYPGGLADYLARFERSLEESIASGFILADDRDEILQVAAEAGRELLGADRQA